MSSSASTPGNADSERKSLETKLTPFSPFNPRDSPKVAANTGAKIISPPIHDPFTNTSAKAKLSPTANNFTPLDHHNSASTALSTLREADAHGTSYIMSSSDPEAITQKTQFNEHMVSAPAEFVPSCLENPFAGYLINNLTHIDKDCTRFLMIENVFTSSTREEIETAFSCQGFSLPTFIVTVDLRYHGIIYASFNDIREAHKAFQIFKETRPKWVIQYIQIEQYMSKYSPGSKIDLSEYKGEVHVTVNYYGSRQRYDAGGITFMVKKLLRGEGDLLSCDVVFSSFPQMSFFARYFDILAARMAVVRLNGSKFTSCCMAVSHVPVELTTIITPYNTKSGPLIVGKEDCSLEFALENLNLTPLNRTTRRLCGTETPPVPGLSPASSNTPTSQGLSEASPFGRPLGNGMSQLLHTPQRSSHPFYAIDRLSASDVYRHGAPRFASHEAKYAQVMQAPNGQVVSPLSKLSLRQHNECLSGHHNVVDVERIRLGLDVRTTIMLRNIPNKIDQAMLKEIVDETSFGKYDFMYLRIDFANNCNVGYAFINFEDPWQIIDFVNARAGHRWNRFNSDKVAEVSYATIQGKDCLVQKFRNSSVMLEHPSFRPKIFHTNGSLSAGQEDSFPSPDNPSKMRRSVENAEHVGLFAPRAGQHFRNQQRRRKSQYDRGTRLAEFEDAYEVEDFASNVVYGRGPRMTPVIDYRAYLCNPVNRY